MKKSIILSLLVAFGSLSFGHQIPLKSLLESHYVVKSDAPNDGVEPDKCHVYGHVKNPNTGLPLQNVIVSTLDRVHDVRTDSLGFYEMMLDASDTSIFAFKSQFAELVIWNYNFRGGHEVELDFFLTEDWGMIEMDKPVIYLYNEEPMDVSLKLKVEGQLTFTYPKYDESWEVHLDQDGISSNGRSYPYLFWEGEKEALEFPKESGVPQGVFICTDSIYSFLENSLTSIGLNTTEQTDFITYWAPRMTQKKYAFVSFLIDEQYEKHVAILNVAPKPDCQKRVFMVYSPTDVPSISTPYQTQKFKPFERKGFTLLEWGGSELPTNILDYETVDF